MGLGGADVENGTCVPKELENHSIVLPDVTDPAYEAGIEIEVLHPDVFLDADEETVEGSDWLFVLGIIGIQVCCTGESALWE